MEGKIKIGPVGHNPGGKPVVNWDEGSHNGIISQIFISHGDDDGIYSIQFQFLLDDKFVLSDRHGQNTGRMFDAILLNCPHEYITGISGTLPSSYSGDNPNIKSLKFTTNTNEYGPFGSSSSSNSYHHSNKKFVLNLGKLSQFGGFYGGYTVSGLHYIGVYLQPTTPKPKTRRSNAEDLESNIGLG